MNVKDRYFRMQAFPAYETLKLTPHGSVLEVSLNRPRVLNAMNLQFFEDFRDCFYRLQNSIEFNVVLINSTNTRAFSAGLDLKDAMLAFPKSEVGAARTAVRLKNFVKMLQEPFDKVAECPQCVICAVGGMNVGAAIDLSSSCDIRLCSADAKFSIKEVDVGLVADIGTTARFPKVIGNYSAYAEYLFTGRTFGAAEAQRIGFVSTIFPDQKSLSENAMKLAKQIASKSPIAVRGCKEMLRYSVDHSTSDIQDHVATWNASMLQTKDMKDAFAAFITKKKPNFAKL